MPAEVASTVAIPFQGGICQSMNAASLGAAVAAPRQMAEASADTRPYLIRPPRSEGNTSSECGQEHSRARSATSIPHCGRFSTWAKYRVSDSLAAPASPLAREIEARALLSQSFWFTETFALRAAANHSSARDGWLRNEA